MKSMEQCACYLKESCDLSTSISTMISEGEKLAESYARNGMNLLIAGDGVYPEKLRPGSQIPPILAIKGHAACLNQPQIAMVGSRETHSCTAQIVSFIANRLIDRGFAITSGGALGTDAMSHRQAMKRNQPTIVVAGTGADIIYPADNRDIFEYAAQHGVIASPYPSNTAGKKFHFPTRNAIIAALSRAVIVVQCRVGSGALYTAQYARRMGIPVLVPTMPGFSDLTEGSLELGRSGKAQWITHAADLDRLANGDHQPTQSALPLCSHDQPSPDENGHIPIMRQCANIAVTPGATSLSDTVLQMLRESALTRECLRQKLIEAGAYPVDFDEILLELELMGSIAQRNGIFSVAA